MRLPSLVILFIVLLLALPHPAAAQAAPVGSGALCGFNVAWIQGKYMTGMGAAFDPADWQRVCARARAAEARVIRVWLLHGMPASGVRWHPADPRVPVGVEPGFLRNVEAIAAAARAHGLSIYWTLMDGAVPIRGLQWTQLEKDRAWNIYNDRYGIGELWRQNVLGPVLDAVHRQRDVTWAIDLLNEVEGPVERGLFRDWWLGARRFLARSASLARVRAPGIRVTASAGWGTAPYDILLGLFDGLGLDFLDLHAYDDGGSIPLGGLLAAHARARGVPIVLGEFGQKSERVDPALQAQVLSGFLQDADRLGFAAAFAWRLEDESPWFSFWDGTTPRPALAWFTWYATR